MHHSYQSNECMKSTNSIVQVKKTLLVFLYNKQHVNSALLVVRVVGLQRTRPFRCCCCCFFIFSSNNIFFSSWPLHVPKNYRLYNKTQAMSEIKHEFNRKKNTYKTSCMHMNGKWCKAPIGKITMQSLHSFAGRLS